MVNARKRIVTHDSFRREISSTLCRPFTGLEIIFSLPTLHGFAGARLQGGLNNFAPAALVNRLTEISFLRDAFW